MPIRAVVFVLVLLLGALARAEVLIIVHAKNPIESIEHKQVVDLFMGRTTALPNGQPARTFDLPSGTPLRAKFYKSLTGKSEAQVDAYWATLIFAGRMSPPPQFPNDQAIIEAVVNNPAAISYVPKQPLPPTVKVIMELTTE